MKRQVLAWGILVVCLASTAALAADVFSGTWQNRNNKNFRIKIEPIPDGLKFTMQNVDASGKPTVVEFSPKFDGKDYPVKGDPTRDTIALKKTDDYTYEQVSKKSGKIIGTRRFVHSRDGKTRTATNTLPDGKVEPADVWDRQ